MAKISNDIISEVLQKTDLVDLISEKVALTKKGKSYFGLCPFHNEKTPSFSVEPDRKIYTCFSCGEKGNAITFKQKTDNLTFVDAVEILADKANISIDLSDVKKESPNQKYFDLNFDAKGFYKVYLNSTKQGQEAIKYLTNRKISPEIISHFELGLAPDEFDLLYKTLSNKGHLVSDMFDLGLVKQSKNENFYDLFRNRIIFPIHDPSGKTIGFSGRIYNGENDAPKYVNSPQTAVFTKSKVLYNLHNAINEIKKNNRVVLFEGYMDVIAAYRAGITESIASMGTSLTTEQVSMIKRYTNNVTICYDGDSAGLEASERALKMFQQAGMNVKIILLPNKLDPDDYINKFNEKALKDYIDTKWISSIRFLYIKLKATVDFSKMLDIEKFKKQIFDLIKNESRTTIEVFMKDMSEDISISIESLRQDFEQYTKRSYQRRSTSRGNQINVMTKYERAEIRLINYFLDNPKKYLITYNNQIDEALFINPEVRDLKLIIEDKLYTGYKDGNDEVFTLESFLDVLTESQAHFYKTKVENKMIELSDLEFEDLIDTMYDYIEYLKQKDSDENIEKALTVQEKIAIAKERDIQIKEAKNGKR